MGFEDIAYDMLKEYRASKNDGKKQIELMKSLAKKTYLRFNFEWITEKESHRLTGRFDGERQILYHFSQLFLDISVEIYDMLPEESERMREISVLMKKGAYGTITNTTNEITPNGDACASKVMEYIANIKE